MGADADEEPTRITAAMLRAGAAGCARRLAHELRNPRSKNRGSAARFAVANRVAADARLAHARGDDPDVNAFVAPADLEVEQRRVYAAAARAYLALCGGKVRLAPAAVFDDWETEIADLAIRLVGDVGVAVEHPDGRRELRRLLVGGRPLDDVDLRFAALRADPWTDGPLFVTSVDLLDARVTSVEIDTAARRKEHHDWLAERVEALRAHADASRPREGVECGRCAFIAGCAAHPEAASRSSVGFGLRQPKLLPQIMPLSPSSYEAWTRCHRLFFAEQLLGVPASDTTVSPDHGLLVHELLRFLHAHGSCRDDAAVRDALLAHNCDDDLYRGVIARHARRCPEGAERDVHEVDLARFHRAPPPMFMATARIDAIWVHDGLLDARDYKTGRVTYDRVADDPRARVQAFVLARHADRRGLRLRLRYEHLALDVDDDPEPFEPEPDDLLAIDAELRDAVEGMWREDSWTGVGEAAVCSTCRYRSICPHSATPGEPTWPALLLAAP
jgi:hypothetical protein